MLEAVRPATAADIPILVRLLEAAVADTPSTRGRALHRRPQRIVESTDRLSMALGSSDQHVVAATLDDHVFGFALMAINEETGERIGMIEELYVEIGARGVGLGEGLLQAAIEWCQETDCAGVDMAVLPGDRSAKNLCERAGLTARSLVMHRALPSAEP